MPPKLFLDYITSKEMTNFLLAMDQLSSLFSLSHTMIGFNFSSNQILSTKFYYVFDELIPTHYFPFPELSDEYSQVSHDASLFHLNTRLVPGAGLTIALKFDTRGATSRGFFMRVARNNHLLINNIISCCSDLSLSKDSFDNGYGQYVMAYSGSIVKNEYVYLKPNDSFKLLGQLHGIDFSATNCIEISSAGQTDTKDQKFIAIGFSNIIQSSFMQRIPDEVIEVFDCKKFQFCCPAVAPEKDLYSIYLLGKMSAGRFSNSPIDCLVSRYRT